MAKGDSLPEQSHIVDVQLFRLAVSWNVVLFPFDQWKLVQLLPQNGYIPPPELSGRVPFGARLESTGVVGTKGSTSLVVDTGRRQIALEGSSPEDVLQEFDQIEDLLARELYFDSKKYHDHYEVDVQALVWTQRNPLDIVAQFWQTSEHVRRLNTAITQECTIFGIRLASSGKNPTSNDWFDVHVEPSIRSPDSCYLSRLVFRQPDRESVMQTAGKAVELLQNLVSLLERT
ncbi:MAG: hypothetical protein HY535_03035 [Chloroflexi bacterium]|nr:hypothetical protein [Chloroflexota bacterium]